MASFLELLESGGPERRPRKASGAAGAPPEVLASVKAEGLRRRRRRHRRNVAIGGLAMAVLAVPAAALLPGGDGDEDITVAGEADPVARTTTTGDPIVKTSTTLATEVLGEVVERPADPTAATTTTRPRTTTTTSAPRICRNSSDPACGAFRWDPAPASNSPLLLLAGALNGLQPGQPAEVVVSWDDDDAELTFADSDADGYLLAEACSEVTRYGPWAPPAANGGSGTLTFPYTAPAEPGTYFVTVTAATGTCDGYDPYHSTGTITVSVTVVAPEETTTTTTNP